MPARAGLIVAGVGLLCSAAALTFVLSARERRCMPLELEFEIAAKKSPQSGRPWDLGGKASRPPDPMGYVTVITDGKRYVESIAQRKNTYAFRGRFYAKRGVPLRRGSKIEIEVLDKDLRSAEDIGEISHQVTSSRGGSVISRNGVLKMAYTCHSDATFLGLFSKKGR